MQDYLRSLRELRTSIPATGLDKETQFFCQKLLDELKNMPLPVPEGRKYYLLDSKEKKQVQTNYLEQVEKAGAELGRLYGNCLMPGRLQLAEVDVENAICDLDENDHSKHYFQFTVRWKNNQLEQVGRIETTSAKSGIWPQVDLSGETVAVTFVFDRFAHIMLFRNYWEVFASITPDVKVDEPSVVLKMPIER